jgi:hypothetical protein
MGADFRLRDKKKSSRSSQVRAQVKRSALLTGNVSLCMDEMGFEDFLGLYGKTFFLSTIPGGQS